MQLPAPGRVAAVLAVVIYAFALANLTMAWLVETRGPGWLVSRIALDEEGNLPSYFAALLLLLAGLLLLAQGRVARAEGDPLAGRWRLLGLVVVVMSVDEASGLHEEVRRTLERVAPDGGLPRPVLALIGGLLVAGAGVLVLPVLRGVPTWVRHRLLVAGVLYAFGAVGLEVLSIPYTGVTQAEGGLYLLLVTVEETLELGSVALAAVTVHRLLTSSGPLRFVVSRSG